MEQGRRALRGLGRVRQPGVKGKETGLDEGGHRLGVEQVQVVAEEGPPEDGTGEGQHQPAALGGLPAEPAVGDLGGDVPHPPQGAEAPVPLPGYGQYTGGVVAFSRRGFMRQAGPREFELSRSFLAALREFVPGNRIYANRGTFYVSKYHLGVDSSSVLDELRILPEKGIVKEGVGAGGAAITALIKSKGSITKEILIKEIEKNYVRLVGSK